MAAAAAVVQAAAAAVENAILPLQRESISWLRRARLVMQADKWFSNLKRIRKEAHLTQEELAKCVGVRRETISQLEAGKGNPSLLTVLKIAKFLKTPVDELFKLAD